jgi:NAD(P)H dehydrogenase (quinone)
LILITGAAGKTGRSIICALVKRGVAVRAMVKNAEQAASIEMLDTINIHIGDLRDDKALEKAVDGIDQVYFIAPNVSPNELEIGRKILFYARQNDVQRFVYHSVLHPQVESMPHHWQKMRLEEKIFESGLEFTILQPCAYMQNILANLNMIIEKGIYAVPYSITARISYVDLEDVAEVAAIVLTHSEHKNATYELAGPLPLSQEEVATIFSNELKKPVIAQRIDRGYWAEKALTSGSGDYQVSILQKMFEYYEKFGLIGNDNILRFLLGRSANSFESFVKNHLAVINKSVTEDIVNHG